MKLVGLISDTHGRLPDAALGALLALALDTAFSRMMDTNDLPQMRRI